MASSTKMIADLFDAYSVLEIGTYKPSSVILGINTKFRKVSVGYYFVVSKYKTHQKVNKC